MIPKKLFSGLCIIAFLAGVSLITSCQKDSATAPNTTSSKSLADSVSTLSVSNLQGKSLAISLTGFATSYTTSGVINLSNTGDLAISGKSINGGKVPAITLTNCHDIHITQNKLENSTNVGIYLVNCKNITIDHNYISNVSCGVYVENSPLGGIQVINNQFKNMQGPYPRGQFVQFNTVYGVNNSITNNSGENIAGASNPQDAINIYMSHGTATSPIIVTGNWIRGGGPSTVGGGIMLGDNGGGYQVASYNTLVNPGQYGMAIAGGDHITITNNTIYAKAQPFTNVGIYVWGQGGYVVTNSTVTYNKVKFANSSNEENDSWLAPGTFTPVGWGSSTNTFNANITSAILPTVITTF